MSTVVLSSQRRWVDSLTHSIPKFEEYPKHLLSTAEQDFLLWLQSFKVSNYYDLVSSHALAVKIKELWSELLREISVESLAKHLVKQKISSTNRSYANREYRVGKRKIGLWLFRKGLVRGFALPARKAKLQYKFGYPVNRYKLVPRNYRSPFPPHNYFASLCYAQLLHGVSQRLIQKVDPQRYAVPHSDGTGRYVADSCYRLTLHEQTKYLWTEVHSGSEGYDERIFYKRLRTMEEYLHQHPKGLYVVFVPFVRDVQRALEGLEEQATTQTSMNPLSLNRIRIMHYYNIDAFKETIGIYQHKTKTKGKA